MDSREKERLHCVKVAHEVIDDVPVTVASIALILIRERATVERETLEMVAAHFDAMPFDEWSPVGIARVLRSFIASGEPKEKP